MPHLLIYSGVQTKCPMNTCLEETLEKLTDENDAVPWWFHTMTRDAINVVSAGHHHLSAPTPIGRGLHFCTMGKIGTTQWRKVICHLQNKPDDNGNAVCIPDRRISRRAPKAVFLRDPLERFLSAYIDKCFRKPYQRHCEPLPVFYEKENGLVEGLNKTKKLLFETYVETMPLKWNMHFFPQRYDSFESKSVGLL